MGFASAVASLVVERIQGTRSVPLDAVLEYHIDGHLSSIQNAERAFSTEINRFLNVPQIHLILSEMKERILENP